VLNLLRLLVGCLFLGKLGAGSGAGAMDPFAGTQVRVIAGLRDGKAVASLTAGAH
jgi:hypothetical protein